jgi:hypothetical protein
VQRGGDREGDGEGDGDRHPVAEHLAERILEQRRERGLAEEADADRGHRDAQLAGRQVAVDRVELADHHP